MRATYITATVIALLILGWLFSGQVDKGDPVRHGTLQNRTPDSPPAAGSGSDPGTRADHQCIPAAAVRGAARQERITSAPYR